MVLVPSVEGCSSHLPSPPPRGIPPELGSAVVAGLGDLPDNTFRFMDGSYFSDEGLDREDLISGRHHSNFKAKEK